MNAAGLDDAPVGAVFDYPRAMKRIPLIVLLIAAPQAVIAACNDPPAAGVDWTGCRKERVVLTRVSLQKGKLDRVVFAGMNLNDADLSGASLRSAEFSRTSFRDAKLEGATFDKAVAVRSNFSGARLSGASLEKVEFLRSNLGSAGLVGAKLTKGDFKRSSFEKADLTNAVLRYANISRANFKDARLAGAELSHAFTLGTDFSGTDLSAVRGLTQDQLDVACGDSKTRLPAKLKRPSSWPCAD